MSASGSGVDEPDRAPGVREPSGGTPVAAVLLRSNGAIEAANRPAQALLPLPAGGMVSGWVAPLGLTAVQWILAQLRRTGPSSVQPGPRVTLPGGRQVRLVMHCEPPDRWLLRLEQAVVVSPPPAGPPAADGGPLANPASAAMSTRPLLRVTPGDDSALRELKAMFWDSPFPVLVQGEDFRITDVNDAFLRYSGYRRDDLIGMDPIVLLHPEDRERHQAERRQPAQEASAATAAAPEERRLVAADGDLRWYREARRRVQDTQGHRLSFSVLHDCTAEHLARERAERTVHELDRWFQLSPVGMLLFDEDGLVLRSNPALLQLVGGVPRSLAQAHPSLQELLGWYPGGPLAALPVDDEPVHRHGWVEHAEGERALYAVVRCLEVRHGRRRFMAVIEDRSAEDALDVAQSQLGALAETTHAGLATFDEYTGRFEFPPAGPPGAQVLLSSELKAISRELVRPETLPEFDRVQQALRQGERVDARYAIEHPELGLRWLHTRVEPRQLQSGRRGTAIVTLDVTEQHLTQQRGERLLRELTTILESTTAGIAYFRGAVLLRCNRQFERLLGLREDGSALQRPLADLLAHVEGGPSWLEQAWAALAHRGQFETEIALGLPGEAVRWLQFTMRRMDSGDPEVEAIVVLSDITRLKLQQDELEAVARDRELMFSLSDVGIVFLLEGRVQRANQGFALLTGYASDELVGLEEETLFVETPGEPRPLFDATLMERSRWTGERLLRRKDGNLCWVQVHKRLVHEGQPQGGVIASYVNVDARRRAEQALATQAERTRAVLDSVLVGIITCGPRGIEWMNRSARRMFGGDLQDFLGKPIHVVAPEDTDHPFRRAGVIDYLEEGQSHTFECQVKARDGRGFWVVGNAVVTGVTPQGREVTYALLDIDSRRQAEQRIAEAQASLQRVIELAPLAIALFDARTLAIQQINQSAASALGRPIARLIGRRPEEIASGPQGRRYREDMEAALRSEGVTQREYRIDVQGRASVWDARFLPLASPGEPAPDQLLLVATNVTEQRAAQEARLEAAIAQRELLVKEVHHRIKNNLQGVAGLLQQIAQRKPEMAGPISEVAGQVQAIAHVYGLQVGAVGPLRLRGVVEAITGSVRRLFDRPIALEFEGERIDEWILPEAESIPIALTLNELLTNAIKHSSGAGAVTCRLESEADAVQIEVSNPGTLPAGFNLAQFPGGVSGLGLIRALLPRRSAQLALEPHGDRVRALVRLTPPGVSRA
ncbi:MAG TPA: PAS domain S-box protein [Burkholderiaceae bacterium]|nr:PAS domain S-box protein [Burkholderiaceae bacterium]